MTKFLISKSGVLGFFHVDPDGHFLFVPYVAKRGVSIKHWDSMEAATPKWARKGSKIIEAKDAHEASLILLQEFPSLEMRLATLFADFLKNDIGEENFQIVRERNVANVGTNICASHDFCDANCVMEAAFRALGIHWEPGDMESKNMKLWNDAWNLAKAKFLTAKEGE